MTFFKCQRQTEGLEFLNDVCCDICVCLFLSKAFCVMEISFFLGPFDLVHSFTVQMQRKM